MNLFVIAYILGQVCTFAAGFMLLPMVCALLYHEYSVALVYFLCALLCLTIGFLLKLLRPENMRVRPKEGMDAAALAWVVISVLGCLPFMITGEIPSFADAFFETVSGFTTTGASIMTSWTACRAARCSGALLRTGLAAWAFWCLFLRSSRIHRVPS